MKYQEKRQVESKGCGHDKKLLTSSSCSFCKIKMMAMPKKIIKNYKNKKDFINW